jgi:sortase A
MNLDVIVVQGTSTLDLEKGPGHYTDTADPWDPHGRVGIAGHRTTYLAPFWSLDKLGPGDAVILRTKYGTYHYDVTGSRTISPSDASVLDQTARPTLVLTTCTPRFSASERLIVFANRTSG